MRRNHANDLMKARLTMENTHERPIVCVGCHAEIPRGAPLLGVARPFRAVFMCLVCARGFDSRASAFRDLRQRLAGLAPLEEPRA
jgi:hypothetical protein